MLTREEREQVQRVFAVALMAKANPPSLIQVVFPDQAVAESILLDLPSGASAEVIAAFTMDACLASRWSRDPSLMEMLLDHLITYAGAGAFTTILNRVRQRVDPNPSVYDSSWLLDNSRPFFDRHDLRGRVRHLIEQNGRPILLVRADEHSYGRSYSVSFLQHLEDCSPNHVHVLSLELPPSTGPSYQVEDLLSDLSTQFRTKSPLPQRTGSSYAKEAARWLLDQIMSNTGKWLVVLDGFGQRPLNDEVRETIEELAYRVPIGQHRRWVRLVLLDYPEALPNVKTVDVLEESLPPVAQICRADLLPCLTAWDALRKKQGLEGAAEGQLDALADDMLTKAPPAGKARLEALNAGLVALLTMPVGGPGGI